MPSPPVMQPMSQHSYPITASQAPPPNSHHLANAGRPRADRVPSNDMRTRGGHLPPNGHGRNMSFEMARSPPNPGPKNTKHVPCKFFRQGACQAGLACPFLHTTDAAADSAPCKYFQKGNCKFGAKCALAHILRDGRRVNRPNFGMGGGGPLNLGGRVNPQATYHPQDSALTNSVLSQQRMNGQPYQYPYPQPQDDLTAIREQQPQPQPQSEGIPSIEAGFVSDTGSKYGSPAEESRLPTSPPVLTLRDVPLPSSFDSQGISHAARYGPVAASVPSRFGMMDVASPPSSSSRAPTEAVRQLRDTAFGSDLRKPLGSLGSSNPGSSPPAFEDAFLGPRFLHSQRMAPRSKFLSASVPRSSALDDWEGHFTMEEDLLPGSLHDDVLTPQERMRRLSRTEQEVSTKELPSRDLSGLGLGLSTSATKASPLGSSPSRFGALFAKQRQKKEEELSNHVGSSPLRESSSPSLAPIGSRRPVPGTSGDASPSVRTTSAAPSMSMISQGLSNLSLHPGSALENSVTSAGGTSAATATAGTTATASTTTSGSSKTAAPSPSRIDEEQSELVFSMEEEDTKDDTKREE
ncbi:hypothetical protein VTN31DRAFT_7410 [Thermomyces dupontii]|uniref:uncharacterized protein n=1 Tax=Talaromyces thermophilus TaxID=28565 RepID=UPI00374309A8